MNYEYKTTRQVEFSHTDMAGIMHFSNYMRFMENAELEMYQAYDIPFHDEEGQFSVGIPRVHAECDYVNTSRFRDVIEIHVLVERLGTKSITYKFIMRNLSRDNEPIVAKGKIVAVVVSVDHVDHDNLESIEIPSYIRNKLKEAPKDLLEPKE